MQLDLSRVRAVRRATGCSLEEAQEIASQSQFHEAIEAAQDLESVKAMLLAIVQSLRPKLYLPLDADLGEEDL